MKRNHQTAVITGASSGIGKAFAKRLAKEGYDLLLTGRRQDLLKHLSSEIKAEYNVNVELICGDLSDPGHRADLARQIQASGSTDILVNNAGFGIDLPFHKLGAEEIRQMIGTHILASTELIYAALPGMIERRHGIIINVSSLASFMPGLCRSMYLATKSFIHNFSQALSIELSNYGIYIQSLCPGFVKTDFFRSHQGPDHAQKYRNMHFTSPEDVVNESFLSIEKGKSLCIPGTMNKIFYLFARLLPIPVFRLIYHLRMEKQDRKKPEPDLIVCYGSAA